MNRRILACILILTLTACSKHQIGRIDTNSELYAMYNNVFYQQYSNQLHHFSQSLNMISSEDLTQEKLVYARGKIDGYAMNTWFVFDSMNKNDSVELDLAVPKEIRPLMYETIQHTNEILKLLSNLNSTQEQLKLIHSNQQLIDEVIECANELNVATNYIKGKDTIDKYKNELQIALVKIKELQDKLNTLN